MTAEAETRPMQPQPRGAHSCRRQEGPSPGRARPCDTSVQTRPPEPGAPTSPRSRASLQKLFCRCSARARQAALSPSISGSLLKLMLLESVMPSSHLILCHPLLLLPSIFPSIRVFSNKSAFHQVAKVLEFQLQH